MDKPTVFSHEVYQWIYIPASMTFTYQSMKTRKEQILTFWKVIDPGGLQVLKQERRWNVDRTCNKVVKIELTEKVILEPSFIDG